MAGVLINTLRPAWFKQNTAVQSVAELSLNYSQYSDEILLGLIKQRDPEALAELYNRHAQIVYTLIFRLIGDPTIAAEILQETFWQIWQEADTAPAQLPAPLRLHRLARIKSLEQLRRQKSA